MSYVYLVLTTVWGFFFRGSKVTYLVAIGLVLVIVSMTLCILLGV